jgi:hypothetical protein
VSVAIVGRTRPNRKAVLGLGVVLLIALVFGLLAGGLVRDVPPVYAAVCQNPRTGCLGSKVTAAVNVEHMVPGSPNAPVQPNTGESWTFTSYWNTQGPGPCYEMSEQASADVNWNGSAWVLSNVNTTTKITAISLCSGIDSCSQKYAHSYNYVLIAELNNPVGSFNPRQVVFATTSVDDGYELDYSSCTTGDVVSPTTQTFSQTDTGTFECGLGCSGVTGPLLQITYE